MSTTIRNVSRREFVAASGFTLAVTLPGAHRLADALAAGAVGPVDPATADPFSPGVYLRIDETGLVTIIAHRSEMGQGIRTARESSSQLGTKPCTRPGSRTSTPRGRRIPMARAACAISCGRCAKRVRRRARCSRRRRHDTGAFP